ncbi:MAG: nucleoside 2-deoxyribosyltransferase [Candidatus Moranbacteria bacterium]|nr:nucleoside 2-deoxyribosyltransferase [Candidatus Moranbacteria bacterium]
MKIYFGHSKGFDYKKELYAPIRNSELNKQHEIIFPHETEGFINSKNIIKDCDLMIAEVSFPATGLGIELGWAEMLGKRVFCVYKKGSKISGSLKVVTNNFIEYSDSDDLAKKVREYLGT